MKQNSVLISIKTPYANLIVDGIKTIELRRRFPTDIAKGTKFLIYATAPTKAIIGECKVKEVRELSINDLWKDSAKEAMIGWNEFKNYFSGLKKGYAIHLYGYIRYDEPIALEQIKGITPRAPQSYRYLPKESEAGIL